MKITIEPTEQNYYYGGKNTRQSVDTMHSTVSISIASDDLDITEIMGQVVKALQGWGFHNESIAKELDEELAWQLGLRATLETRKTPEDTVMEEEE